MQTVNVAKDRTVFDESHYAATWSQKLVRSLQLGPRYYASYLPRYLWHRITNGMSPWDWQALWNPLREFRLLPGPQLTLPDRYDEALRLLVSAGVRLNLPPARTAGVVAMWWASRCVPGDMMECGAYRGGTSLLLAVLGRLYEVSQTVLVLDAFSGIDQTSPFDVSRTGHDFVPASDQVETIHRQAEALGVDDRIDVHKGLFADSFRRLATIDRRFAFVHIDANLYESTLEACEYTFPRMSPGGVIVFDDYNGVCDLGARLAVDRSLSPRGFRPSPLAGCSAFVRVGN